MDKYGLKTVCIYTVYGRKLSVLTTFTVRFRILNSPVLTDLGMLYESLYTMA